MQIITDQVAIVTGGAGGIGFAIAHAFAKRGLKIVIADLDQGSIDEAVRRLSTDGVDATGLRCDVSRLEDVEQVRDETLKQHGRVDIIVNNAGIVSPFRPIWENTHSDWHKVLGVNLWGVVHGVQTFVPLFVSQGHGYVVNIASMAGLMVVPSNGIYNAAKHAVVSISETMRVDLDRANSPVGITVVCPGLVSTKINDQQVDSSVSDIAGKDATFITPEEVARQVVIAVEQDQLYLATNEGSVKAIHARVDRLFEEAASPL